MVTWNVKHGKGAFMYACVTKTSFILRITYCIVVMAQIVRVCLVSSTYNV